MANSFNPSEAVSSLEMMLEEVDQIRAGLDELLANAPESLVKRRLREARSLNEQLTEKLNIASRYSSQMIATRN